MEVIIYDMFNSKCDHSEIYVKNHFPDIGDPHLLSF